MKKITNKYRKCPNCPHHNLPPQKCCCLRNSTSRKVRAMTSRNKREPSTIDHSSAVNTSTIPTIPTIIAEFSSLRTQNNHLKRELLNVSTFLKDQSFHAPSVSDPSLSEKLFLSNKNLKESLLEIDNISKANKQLCDRNRRLSEQGEGLRIQLRQAEDYLDRYKKKCRRKSKDQENSASQGEIEKVVQQNSDLEQEIQELKEQIRCLSFDNQNMNMVGALSPQWVAHTGNKGRFPDLPPKNEEEISKEEIETWKRSLSETINLLKNQSIHLSSTSLETPSLVGLDGLIEQLIESYSQSMLSHFQLLMKQINRKLNNYQKKMNNLALKLQNFIIISKNKRLKKRLHHPLTAIKTQRLPMTDLTNRML